MKRDSCRFNESALRRTGALTVFCLIFLVRICTLKIKKIFYTSEISLAHKNGYLWLDMVLLSFKRCSSVVLLQLVELNTFFVKHIFAVDTSHPVVFWRLIMIGAISAPSIRLVNKDNNTLVYSHKLEAIKISQVASSMEGQLVGRHQSVLNHW